MANKFKLWVDDSNINSTQTYEDFSADTQRAGGFVGGTPASAIRVNTALRQANLIACALMDAVAPNDNTTDFRSTRSDVSDIVKNGLKSLSRKLIWSGDVYVVINNTASSGGLIANLPFTFDNGKIYEVQGYFETPMTLGRTSTYQWKTTCSPTYQVSISGNLGTYTIGVSSLWGNFSMDGTTDFMFPEIHTCEIQFFYGINSDTNLAQHDVEIFSSFPHYYVNINNIQTDVNPEHPYMVVGSKIGITKVFEIIE